MAVTSVALLSGTLGVVSVTAAHAATSNAFYVTPAGDGGSDAGNNCELPAKPCATIEHAINEAALLAPNAIGAVINLSKGTFDDPADTMFEGLGNGANTDLNNNLTITGGGIKGKKATIVSPQSCSSLATVTDPASPDSGDSAIAVFDAPLGVTANSINGVTIENIDLDGAGVAGGACTDYDAGVINTSGEENAVVQDEIQSGTTYGILTDDDANSTIISNVLTPVLCTTLVKGPNTGLNENWSTPANLIIKGLPKCAKFIESGHGNADGIFINGVAYCITTSAAKKNLVITGTPTATLPCATTPGAPVSQGPDVTTGSTVIFNTSTAPFTQFGIACNSPLEADTAASETTVCAISDNTVTGGGTVYGDITGGTPPTTFPPVGIVATAGAQANVDGNSVSDVADVITAADGSVTNNGIGIGLIDDTSGCSAGNSIIGTNDALNVPTGKGNTLGATSANDIGIQVTGNSSATCSVGLPSYEVNDNTVSSGNSTGIDLANLGVTSSATQGSGGLDNPLAGNSVSGVATGAGIETDGITEQTIGGPLGTEGNSVSGSGVGLVLAPCVAASFDPGSTCVPYNGAIFEPSQDNLIQNNTFSGNIAYGVLAVGSYQVDELAAQVPTAVAPEVASIDNTFNANNWGTATSATNGTLPSEINGAEIEDGTGWGGGCNSEVGDCPTPENPLTFAGPNETFGPSFPGAGPFTLAVCNTNTDSEILPVGTEITFNTPNVLFSTAGEPNDGGTFFVTQDAIITGDNCTNNEGAPYTLNLEAIAPAKVGTLSSPSGQPYILGEGDQIFVDANGTSPSPGAPTETAQNFYGTGAESNSCTPADVSQTAGDATGTSPYPHGAKTTPDVFGATDPPTFPFAYSTTVQASTGGVNATYATC
jgi:hypothetical protein